MLGEEAAVKMGSQPEQGELSGRVEDHNFHQKGTGQATCHCQGVVLRTTITRYRRTGPYKDMRCAHLRQYDEIVPDGWIAI